MIFPVPPVSGLSPPPDRWEPGSEQVLSPTSPLNRNLKGRICFRYGDVNTVGGMWKVECGMWNGRIQNPSAVAEAMADRERRTENAEQGTQNPAGLENHWTRFTSHGFQFKVPPQCVFLTGMKGMQGMGTRFARVPSSKLQAPDKAFIRNPQSAILHILWSLGIGHWALALIYSLYPFYPC